jgi:hypothetical protein
MASDYVELNLHIRPGRYDTANLSEYMKTFMTALASEAVCGVLADFSNVKFFAGDPCFFLDLKRVPSFPRRTTRAHVRTFDVDHFTKYLYDSCTLTIRFEASEERVISTQLDKLTQRIQEWGGRLEQTSSHPLTLYAH